MIAPWQQLVARLVLRSMYPLLLVVPVTGWVASVATGIDVVILARITLPVIVPPSEIPDQVFFPAHSILTMLLVGLLLLHIIGAMHRHMAHRDRSLRRMVFGKLILCQRPYGLTFAHEREAIAVESLAK